MITEKLEMDAHSGSSGGADLPHASLSYAQLRDSDNSGEDKP